jgi:RHS repeat-associated protein
MVQYLYDADGNRIGKGNIARWNCDSDPNDTNYNGFTLTNEYVLGPGGEQVTELDGSGNWMHSNAYAGGQLVATLDTANQDTYQYPAVHYQLADWLGTRRAQVSPIGQLEETCQNLPFGDQMNCVATGMATADDATEHHFTGKERDAESGLDYFGARYYSSSMGRMMSPDPAGVRAVKLANPQTWNWYAYVQNNPLRFTDPTGMYTCADDHNKCATDKDKAFETSRQNDLGSKDKGVAAAAKAYGDPTKDNHVSVGFTDAKNGDTSLSVSVKSGVVSSQINVLIPNGATGTALDGVIDHEGTHVEQGQALLGSFNSQMNFNGTLNLSSYGRELPAYQNQASVWQQSGQAWTMNGNGQFVVNPGDNQGQVNDTINQFLKDPANGYGVTPQNPGAPWLTFQKAKQ